MTISAPCTIAWAIFPAAILPSGISTIGVMPALAAYADIEADVLPVDAQTTACAPSWQATEIAAVMPRSLNEPVGLSPSTLSHTSASDTSVSQSEWTNGVPPSRRVTGSRSSGIRSRSGRYSAITPRHWRGPGCGRSSRSPSVSRSSGFIRPSPPHASPTSPRARSSGRAAARRSPRAGRRSRRARPRRAGRRRRGPPGAAVWIETSSSAKAVAISASTPARSSTSIAMW